MSQLSQEEREALTTTTDDGYRVSPATRWDMATGEYVQDGWSARYVGDHYYYEASHGATVEEALDKARKAMRRRLAQRDEDRAIADAYGADARRLARYAADRMPGTGLPDNLKPGLQVWVWGHGKARRAIVGTVSKTGKRVRLIWVAPSNQTVHITSASLNDLQVIS